MNENPKNEPGHIPDAQDPATARSSCRGRGMLHVVPPVDASDCIIWPGQTLDGYGVIMEDGRLLKAHRVAYEERFGSIPPGMVIDHLCRNHGCVNPDHLEAVTSAENTRRGKRAKLTAAEVMAVRALKGKMSYRQIGERFGVSSGTISMIMNGQTWRDVA